MQPMPQHRTFAAGWIDQQHQRLDLGDLTLESGQTLRNAFVSYVVHACTSRMQGPAILVTTAIGSTHHRLDFLIGPGNALDTDKYSVIVVDAIGNGLSISPSNSQAQPGADFPRFTIRDMVESQRLLLDHLGIDRLAAVVGASMGGMQVLQWGVSHPRRMKALVAMTPMARTTAWSQLVNEMARRALFVDPACRCPRPRQDAMRLWTPLTQFLMTRTPAALESVGSGAQLLEAIDMQVTVLHDDGPDPFDWCAQSRAYDAHDVGTTAPFAGDTVAALASIQVPTLVFAPQLDLYNPAHAAQLVADAVSPARFIELPGDGGHASAAGQDARANGVIRTAVRALLAGQDSP